MPILGNLGAASGKVPGTPTVGTVTSPSSTSASVPFTAPAFVGKGGTVTYRAISSPGGIEGTSTTSPITVNGLTAGTAYTFTVRAETTYGVSGQASSSSNSITPQVSYAVTSNFNASGTYTVPSGTNMIAVSVLGGGNSGNAGNSGGGSSGGSGGNGGNGSRGVVFNSYAVTPGQSFSVTVAGASGTSSFSSLASASSNSASSNVAGAQTVNGGTSGNGGGGGSSSSGGTGNSGNLGSSANIALTANTNYTLTGAGGGGGGGGGGGSPANYKINYGGGAGGSQYTQGGSGGGSSTTEELNKVANAGSVGSSAAANTGRGGGGGGGGGGSDTFNQPVGASGAAGGSGASGQVKVFSQT
jgi:hypothetical protein